MATHTNPGLHADEQLRHDQRQEDLALAVILAGLIRLKRMGRIYIRKAWILGQQRALELRSKPGRVFGEVGLYEESDLGKEIAAFERLVDTHLGPAWVASVLDAKGERAITKVLRRFTVRLSNYADYLWGVSQVAFRENLPEDALVAFVGPDDGKECNGCAEAVRRSPYRVQEAPRPGSFECYANCRHELVLISDGASLVGEYA